jgi:hypothetical protein
MAGILKVDQYQDFNGNNIMTSDGSGNITLSSNMNTAVKASAVNTPAFFARMTSNQTVTNDSATKIAFSSEVYDTDGTYDTSNYRFTPGVVGKYIIGFAYWADNNDNIKTANLYIYKNGSVSNLGSLQYITRLNSGTFSRIAMSATFQVDVTSTSDYFEAYAKIENTSGDARINGQTSKDNNYFYGYKLST